MIKFPHKWTRPREKQEYLFAFGSTFFVPQFRCKYTIDPGSEKLTQKKSFTIQKKRGKLRVKTQRCGVFSENLFFCSVVRHPPQLMYSRVKRVRHLTENTFCVAFSIDF